MRNRSKMQFLPVFRVILPTFTILDIVYSVPETAKSDIEDIQVTVSQKFTYSAVIRWEKESFLECEVALSPTNQSSLGGTVIIDKVDPGDTYFVYKLTDLTPDTEYKVVISCYRNKAHTDKRRFVKIFRTNGTKDDSTFPVQVPSSPVKTHSDSVEATSTPSNFVFRQKVPNLMNTVDITLGVIFGLFGAVVLSVGIFYVWRKFKRRQRIRRFVRHHNSDDNPFTSLNSDHEDGTDPWTTNMEV